MPKVTTPEAGTVVEQVTRSRVIPAGEVEQSAGKDAFAYMATITQQAWDEGNHIVYLYRTEPALYRNGNEPLYVGKYATRLTEEEIQRDCGGGRFKVIVKRGLERVGESRCQIGGTPRDMSRTQQEFDPSRPGGLPADPSATSSGVLSQAITAATNPAAQAAAQQIVTAGATAAIEMVKANAPHQMSIPEILTIAKELSPKQAGFLDGPFGPIMIAVVTKLVDRLFTDPFDNIVKMAELAKTFGGGGSTANDWKTAMVQAAPQLANAVTAGLHELRLGAEASAPRVIQQNQLPPAPAIAGSQATAGAPASNVLQMPPAASQPPLPGTAPAPGQLMEVPVQFIWQKIAEFMNDPSKTGREIGEWLDDLDPAFIASVKGYTVDQVTTYVTGNPAIAAVATHPRFRQCLTELIAWANELPAAATDKPA